MPPAPMVTTAAPRLYRGMAFPLTRRAALALPALALPAQAETPLLRLATGPRGSVAEAYGAALCAALPATTIRVAPRHSLGSAENLQLLEASQVQFACAWQESIAQSLAGPRPPQRLRALAAILGQPLVLRAAGLPNWQALDGKRIGCSPAAEATLATISQTLALRATTITEAPETLATLHAEGRLEAILLAPGQPIPAALAHLPPVPLAPTEATTLRPALPGLAPALLPDPGGAPIPGLAAWLLLLAHAGLAPAWAEPVATLALSPALASALPHGALPVGEPSANPLLPGHPGARAPWARAGHPLPEPL